MRQTTDRLCVPLLCCDQVRRKLMNTRRKMEEMLNSGSTSLVTAGDAPDADEWYATEEELAQPLLTIYWCVRQHTQGQRPVGWVGGETPVYHFTMGAEDWHGCGMGSAQCWCVNNCV